jgi:N6-L-threonylcarbamoyladenine synthase
MVILGIETSCDETSAAVVRDGSLLANIVSSQVDLHAVYGGVVPEIASRQHLKLIDAVIVEACQKAQIDFRELDAVAVTRGPGLPSALLVGVSTARGLALRYGKPLMPIHHMEAHLYSPALDDSPFMALIVSGGHTMLVYVSKFGHHQLLGQTRDDAAGEAFDKAAQLLGLGYPGGPRIEKEGKSGNARRFDFPRPMLDSPDWNFSFSGLKTALRRTVTSLGKIDASITSDLCASFQSAIVEVLTEKTLRATKVYHAKQIAVSGGVACNGALRAEFERRCGQEGIRLSFAEKFLCTDNAAMIAFLAEKKLRKGFQHQMEWDIEPDWVLT